MFSKRQLVIGLLVPLLVFQLACHKKQAAQKPKLPGPAEAPTLTQSLPYEIQPEPVPEPPAQSATVQEPQDSKPKNKSRSRNTKKAQPNQAAAQGKAEGTAPVSPSPAAGETTTAAIHPPPNPAEAAAAVAIGPDVSSAEAARDRKSTTDLLDTTEKDLKRVDGKGLSSDQQAMLAQIRNYISQSRKAIAEGDYERASNLAKKAQLLTDELLK